jgi:large subunit ribosomal protein L21
VYAVIETGGKQYRVEVGQQLSVERLHAPRGQQVEITRVLAVATDGDVTFGQPLVKGARVVARSLGEQKAPKIIVFKYKPKVRYRRKTGHRQIHTLLRVEQIITGQEPAPEPAAEELAAQASGTPDELG